MSTKTQHARVKKVVGSAHKMNTGGNAAVPHGEKSHTQNKKTGQKTRVDYEGARCVICIWVPSMEKDTVEEQDESLTGNRFAILATESEEAVFNRQVRKL